MADLEHLLDIQRPARPEAFSPGFVIVETETEITEQRFDVRLLRVHRSHHQQADGVVQGQQLVRIEHSRSFTRVKRERETLRWINRERSREKRYLV
ncbi:hypothetical protein D3C81_569890 [compost metagenome]